MKDSLAPMTTPPTVDYMNDVAAAYRKTYESMNVGPSAVSMNGGMSPSVVTSANEMTSPISPAVHTSSRVRNARVVGLMLVFVAGAIAWMLWATWGGGKHPFASRWSPLDSCARDSQIGKAATSTAPPVVHEYDPLFQPLRADVVALSPGRKSSDAA